MLERVRNLWRPEIFHYRHRLQGARLGGSANRFEGWYFKLVDAAGRHPYAIIPGIFLGEDPHSFVQVLDGARGEAWYYRYSVDDFVADPDVFDVQIGPNRFGSNGLSLKLDPKDASTGPIIRGEIQLGNWSPWPVTRFSPGVMGPYSFTPMMQCNHGILSLDHSLEGMLDVGGDQVSYDDGRGYLEKDWGRSFPLGYVWTQSNHFERSGICVTASVATIPWVTGSFRGFLVGFLHDGTLHRFTTYTGAKIESLSASDTHVHLCVSNRELRLQVDARKEDGAVLRGPYESQMRERVAETMTSEVTTRLERKDGVCIFEGTGKHACLEAQSIAHVLD